MTTFKQIQDLAQALYEARTNRVLADEVSNMVDAARINADDTCYVEKSMPVEEYDAVALTSLEQGCCYAEANQLAAVAWFTANGVKF
jgi:hypothetical protein